MTVVTEGDKYTDMLPSLNLAFEFPDDLKLRFAAAAPWRDRAWMNSAVVRATR